MPWLPDVLIVAGSLGILAGSAKGNIAYIRYFTSKQTIPANRLAVTRLEVAYEGVVGGVIAAIGIELLVVGMVLGSYIAPAAVLWPAGLLLGTVLAAWMIRRTASRLGR